MTDFWIDQLLDEEPERCAAVVGLALNHILLVANVLYPFMPETARRILEQLGIPEEKRTFSIPDIWTGNTVRNPGCPPFAPLAGIGISNRTRTVANT